MSCNNIFPSCNSTDGCARQSPPYYSMECTPPTSSTSVPPQGQPHSHPQTSRQYQKVIRDASFWTNPRPQENKYFAYFGSKDKTSIDGAWKPKCPKIQRIEWGVVEVLESPYDYKDVKLGPYGSRSWNWQENGTHHIPGVQIKDIQELLEQEIDFLVISRGFQGRLNLPRETVEHAEIHKVEVIHVTNEAAMICYNSLVNNGKRVGGLFHSTC